jgi:tRNA-dihydrouridine synthase
MIARGALKAPWIAQDYRNHFTPSEEQTFLKIKTFLNEYKKILMAENITERGLLKQSKSVTRFMLDGLRDSEKLRRKLILSQSVSEFYSIIDQF